MKAKFFGLLVLGATMAFGLSSNAGARDLAPTQVKIQIESDGFSGIVKSSKANKCANGRKVIVYKQKGDAQDPHSDKKVGSDIAQANNNEYQWSTGNSGQVHHGDYYAHVKKTEFCLADSSKTVSA